MGGRWRALRPQAVHGRFVSCSAAQKGAGADSAGRGSREALAGPWCPLVLKFQRTRIVGYVQELAYRLQVLRNVALPGHLAWQAVSRLRHGCDFRAESMDILCPTQGLCSGTHSGGERRPAW
jgi:hypothetical protein